MPCDEAFRELIREAVEKNQAYLREQDAWRDVQNFIENGPRYQGPAYMHNGVSTLACPYWIGVGNPRADILFIGLEPAVAPEPFTLECPANAHLWEKVCNGEDSPCSPLFQPHVARRNLGGGHTWAIISKVIAAARRNLDWRTLFRADAFEDSLFFHCFLGEYYTRAAPNHEGAVNTGLVVNQVLRRFYARFHRVIIHGAEFLGNPLLSELRAALNFNVQGVALSHLDAGKPLGRMTQDGRRLLLTHHLSGAAGFTNEALNQLGRHLAEAV